MDNAFISSFYFRNAIAQGADFEKTPQWDALLDLTHAVWRVSDITVENELLKNKLKEGAMDILTEYPNVVAGNKNAKNIMEKMRAQCALLSLAQKTVHGSREMNFFILKNEYYKISTTFSQYISEDKTDQAKNQQKEEARHHNEEKNAPQKPSPFSHDQKEMPLREQAQREDSTAPVVVKKPVAVTNTLNDRQKKIVQFFNKRKGDNVRLKEIAHFFPDLTDRTVRNDLRDLCVKKMISRSEGYGQASFYRLAKNGIIDGIGGEDK